MATYNEQVTFNKTTTHNGVSTFNAIPVFTLGLTVSGGATGTLKLTTSGTTWYFGGTAATVTEAGAFTGVSSSFSTSVTTPLLKAYDGNGIKLQENGGNEIASFADNSSATIGYASAVSQVSHTINHYSSASTYANGALNFNQLNASNAAYFVFANAGTKKAHWSASQTYPFGVGSATGNDLGFCSAAGQWDFGAATRAVITSTGIIQVNNDTEATTTTDGSLQTDGGLSVVKVAYIGGRIICATATDATSVSDGAIQTAGGLSVTKKAFIGETLKVAGQTTMNAGTAGAFTIPTGKGSAAQVLTSDGGGAAAWTSVGTGSGIGDVIFSGAAPLDNEITRFDSTTGKLIQAYTSTGPTASDTGVITVNNATDAGSGIGSIVTLGGIYSTKAITSATKVTTPLIVSTAALEFRTGTSVSALNIDAAGKTTLGPTTGTMQSVYIPAFGAEYSTGVAYINVLGGKAVSFNCDNTVGIAYQMSGMYYSSGYKHSFSDKAGVYSVQIPSATATATALEWYSSQNYAGVADRAATPVLIGSSTHEGTWIFAPANGTLLHKFNARSLTIQSSGTTCSLNLRANGTTDKVNFSITNGGGFSIDDDQVSNKYISGSSAGAITLGSATSTNEHKAVGKLVVDTSAIAATNPAGITVSGYYPSLILEDLTATENDFQIALDANITKFNFGTNTSGLVSNTVAQVTQPGTWTFGPQDTSSITHNFGSTSGSATARRAINLHSGAYTTAYAGTASGSVQPGDKLYSYLSGVAEVKIGMGDGTNSGQFSVCSGTAATGGYKAFSVFGAHTSGNYAEICSATFAGAWTFGSTSGAANNHTFVSTSRNIVDLQNLTANAIGNESKLRFAFNSVAAGISGIRETVNTTGLRFYGEVGYGVEVLGGSMNAGGDWTFYRNITAAGTAQAKAFYAAPYGNYMAMRMDGGTGNAATRDWGLAANYDAVGEFCIRVSAAQSGDPYGAGTSAVRITNTGVLTLGPAAAYSHKLNGFLSCNGSGTSGSGNGEHPYIAVKKITGTFGAGGTVRVAHGMANIAKVVSMTIIGYDAATGQYVIPGNISTGYIAMIIEDATNLYIANGSQLNGDTFTVTITYES